ncbi:dethiobiotin synthase [Coxiella endosymbiont of Rhipicephalus microplus]|uniref:dethiobiotin synthase n=1 Tax=Coxiella endosymbiont of Rhipicephalus microplus TaxID=1656186 RepID=UPI000CB2BA46|nr:dethiobiotin synthase [Coxiella endosymbiont of Rhipicephalus microplus]PMB54880.1 Dethiobiotin synthetase [Coxiella-like endosymbiont]
MVIKFFVTGTDTNVGKTYISTALLRTFTTRGFSTFGIKPIASGCQNINGVLRNEDALALQEASSVKKPYEYINPVAFEAPIAPHIASQLKNVTLTTSVLLEKINKSLLISSDVCIIEGVGGWFVPLNNQESMADLVKLLNIPVVLVVGIKLGCLNHTILTVNAINQMKIPLIGWVANCIESQTMVIHENIQTLKTWIKAPFIGIIRYGENPQNHLSLQPLLNFFKKRSLLLSH